jgi:hypothetical protein
MATSAACVCLWLDYRPARSRSRLRAVTWTVFGSVFSAGRQIEDLVACAAF